jgi:hypothetical protein
LQSSSGTPAKVYRILIIHGLFYMEPQVGM